MIRTALVLAVAGLWACAVDLGIEKRDGWPDPSTDDLVEDEAGDPVDAPDEPDVEPDVEPDEPDVEPDEPDVEPEPACEGLSMWDVCWYLGEANETCDDICGAHGGISDQAPQYVGSASEGGSSEECEELLTALGHVGEVTVGAVLTGRGFGCHLWSDGTAYWVEDVDLDPGTGHPQARIVCGCNE